MVTVTIKNYSGTTTLDTFSDNNTPIRFHLTPSLNYSAEFVDNTSDDYYWFTYSGTDTFLGFSSVSNGTAEYTSTEYSENPLITSDTILYAVGSNDLLVTYKHMTYDGNKVQVDSAIRDGNGVKIDTNYQRKHTTATATLSSSSWSSNAQTVSVSGVTASNTVIVSPAPSSISDYSSAGIYCSAQGSGTLTFTCTTVPTTNITVNVVILT